METTLTLYISSLVARSWTMGRPLQMYFCSVWWHQALEVQPVIMVRQTLSYPLHRENKENGQQKSLSGKTQGIWKFCKNTGKTQGNWCAQFGNSLILKIKDILIFAAKISNFFFSWISLPKRCFRLCYGQFCVDSNLRVKCYCFHMAR